MDKDLLAFANQTLPPNLTQCQQLSQVLRSELDQQTANAREQEKAAQESTAKLTKANEELRQCNRLLEAMAMAANALLTVENFDEAVNTALQIMGEGLDTARVALIENFESLSDPLSVDWRILYEWRSSNTVPQISHPNTIQGTYEGIGEWYDLLSRGQSISYLLEETPEPFCALLNPKPATASQSSLPVKAYLGWSMRSQFPLTFLWRRELNGCISTCGLQSTILPLLRCMNTTNLTH